MANSNSKSLEKALKKKLKEFENLSVSEALNIILNQLKKKGKFSSCLLTDSNGLIMAEAVHKQDVKENMSATSALIDDTSDRISDYLDISNIALSYFVSKNVMVWMLPIVLPKSNVRYNLLVTKAITILTSMPKPALKLLGKEEINVTKLLDISSNWIVKVCKD